MNKDYYEAHFDSCDFCSEVYDSNLTDAEKDRLINDHAINAYADASEMAYEAAKDRETN